MNSIIVLSGPSGCGKSTLIRKILQWRKDLVFSISHTTRDIRDRETEGKDYYFISKEEFERMIAEERFVEWALVHGNYYGTSLDEVRSKSSGRDILILDIDVQGAKQIKDKFPEAHLVFVAPPSMEELERRLLKREKQMNDHLQKRLEEARNEMRQYSFYDYTLVNQDVNITAKVLNGIINAYRYRSFRQGRNIQRILQEAE